MELGDEARIFYNGLDVMSWVIERTYLCLSKLSLVKRLEMAIHYY
jgi:hypothetical protein